MKSPRASREGSETAQVYPRRVLLQSAIPQHFRELAVSPYIGVMPLRHKWIPWKARRFRWEVDA